MCCEGWNDPDEKVNGECLDCGCPTVDGDPQSGCSWSPVVCDTCGWQPCDGSCQENMMNVYVVTYEVDNEKTVYKVFAEMEQAEFYCREMKKKHNGMQYDWEEYPLEGFED